MTRQHVHYHDWLIERFQHDPAEADGYLQMAFREFQQDGNVAMLARALNRVVAARANPPHHPLNY